MLPFQTRGENIEVNIKMQTEFDTPGYILLIQSKRILEQCTVKFQSIQEKACFLVN